MGFWKAEEEVEARNSYDQVGIKERREGGRYEKWEYQIWEIKGRYKVGGKEGSDWLELGCKSWLLQVILKAKVLFFCWGVRKIKSRWSGWTR
jgi:hypothetical protein